MKVPYLNKKIDEEFGIYCLEFQKCFGGAPSGISGAIAQPSEIASGKVYRTLYPLFTLIRGLSSSKYSRNPAREIVLSELQHEDKAQFIKALKSFSKADEFSTYLARGVQKKTFSAYFEELASDCLLLLNSFYMNNYRGVGIALRCMLEDLYRHLYFKDHPEEYWAQSEAGQDSKGIHISPKELREYLPTVSYLKKFGSLSCSFEQKKDAKEFDLFGTNDRLYAIASAYVHGGGRHAMNTFKSNSDFSFDSTKADSLLAILSQYVSMAVAFLVSAHLDHFLAFSDYEKSLILGAFNKPERGAFRGVLNV